MEHFGLGLIAGVPVGVANPTPIPFGLAKGFNYGIDQKYAKERGGYRDPVVVAASERDIAGKIDTISIFGAGVGKFLGVTPAAGSKIPVPNEVATIPTTPFQVTAANGATFANDWGVLDNTNGLYMTRVANSPTTGQYAVDEGTGVYTFAAADAGHKVSISYTYTAAAAGKTISVVQTLQGIVSGFVLVGFGPSRSGKALGIKFFNAYLPKLDFALKASDFTMQNVEFFAAQDTTSTSICDIYTGE